MLRELLIQNLALVDHLVLPFEAGMTVLTGETGAGKSILLDALSLCLGERAEVQLIRPGKKTADVSAVFDIENLENVKQWLTHHDLFETEAEEENSDKDCILRRVITDEGRSRAYINGRAVTLTQLREIGELLVNIHGQHQHQVLLKSEHQKKLLDHYAQHDTLIKKVGQAFQAWDSLRKEKMTLLELCKEQDKLSLLNYQLQEILELKPLLNELETLHNEQRKLSHAANWLLHCDNALNLLQESTQDDTPSMTQLLSRALLECELLKNQFPELKNSHELLNNAWIQIEEASHDILAFKDTITLDPEKLAEIDARLNQLHTVARKHRIQPEALVQHQAFLQTETQKLENLQEKLDNIEKAIQEAETHYFTAAEALSQSRKKSAKQLTTLITQSLKTLEMQHGEFEISFANKHSVIPHADGIDEIEFLVTTNPGHPPALLRKIASGGELSRISLAIQVITAQKMITPTLIFDEVDVGVSGKTAETVGKLLRKLGTHAQVMCVTHLPQVAAQGHQHYKVEKHQTKTDTKTAILPLQKSEKIQEIARLLGGVNITKHALLHAEEMLA